MTAHGRIVAAQAAVKEDLYYVVHKGIRFASARMLVRLGATDPGDEAALVETLGALDAHLALSLSHLTHENRAIHPEVEARVPGGSQHAGEDHHHHLRSIRGLRVLVDEVMMAGADRPARLRRLYQRFALFMADDLTHMHEEETELQPLIEAHFSGPEITAIRERIVSAIPPAEGVAFKKAMLGAASPSERVGMVTGYQAAMPADAFRATMDAIVGAPWRIGDWAALEHAVC